MNRNNPRGLRVSRVPGKPVLRDADGDYAIHLWLRHDGKFDGDITLQLSPTETELLHAELCFALDGEPVRTYPDDTPDCRKDPRGFASRMRWP
ncbi:hypothetical protein FCH28_35245 [Streptomyces piniterrae]|uniref:Uncharacterized protein n=1 Tax=Streptomyces piniterrae TaxID=2571125 RepID=A0A4U0MNB7_9ACTN|nr:hypothetical protein [Streptomyces piniterrae]TJZ42270.1 hypothetical protein FCH28_35245 [Streptomyces piniterrae]